MKFFIILLFCIAYCTAFKFTKLSSKIRRWDNTNLNTSVSYIEDTIDCGGKGTLINIMTDTCSVLPCDIYHDVEEYAAFAFVLSQSTSQIHFYTTFYALGQDYYVVFEELIDDDLVGGWPYVYELAFIYHFDPSENGMVLHIRPQMFNTETEEREFCRLFPVRVHSAIPTTTLPTTVTTKKPCSGSYKNKIYAEEVENFELDSNMPNNVIGVQKCGGNGVFQTMTIPGCTNQPCSLSADRFHNITLNIVTSINESCPILKQHANISGRWFPVYSAYIVGDFNTGTAQRISFNYFADSDAAVINPIQMRTIIYSSTFQVDICLEYSVRIVN